MAAYAALVSLMNNIKKMMNHPHLSTCFDHQLIQPLLKKVNLLINFMDANNYGAGSREADDLEREIASAAHAAENVIESHIVDQIRAGTSKMSLRCLLDQQQKIQDLEAVLKKANEFKVSKRSVEERHISAVKIGETAMVGLDAELYKLLEELTNEYPSSRETISIVGMGGTGKTTLAKTIYEHKLIKEHFDFRAWAAISQQHNAKEIFAQLLSNQENNAQEILAQLHSGQKEISCELGLLFHKNLTNRRYLIILDDIWSVEAWEEVKNYFPDNNNGSRILLTTRLSNVANGCCSSPFMMKFLDENNSWKLFCEKVFKNEPCPSELEKVGREIVKLCKGLALSIVVMGGLLLKSPTNLEYWKGFAKDIKYSISYSKESLDILSLSYNHLPPHLKPCFLYMGIFKEDSEIRVSKVVKLWVAEGFIKPNGSQSLEEIGEGYIKDLAYRNLIFVGRWRKNGKIGSFDIHDLLRDLCIKLGEQQEFFHICSNKYKKRGTERRLICPHTEDLNPLARCIMTTYLKQPINEYGLLRVFVCEHSPGLNEAYENVNLRYLSHKFWRTVPTSLFLLWDLQTLIFDKNYFSSVTIAPTEIWKMRQLRHVECDNIYLPPCNGQDELSVLENLQTLKMPVNLGMFDEVCIMIANIKKLYLNYDIELHGYDNSLIEYLCNLDRLHKLESLNLIIQTSRWTHIKNLAFPCSLKKLSLSNWLLQGEDLTVIGSLPHLQVLILYYNSINEEKWSPLDGQFLHLKYLKIVDGWLECWDADSSHFPVLEKLLLIRLHHLKEIPQGIGDIPTLELIHVEDCSVSAAISAVKIKEEQESLGNDGLQVQVKISK